MRVFGADNGVRSDLSCGPGSEVADGRAHSRNPASAVLCCSGRRFASVGGTSCPPAPGVRKSRYLGG